VLDGDPAGAGGVQVVQELAEQPLGALQAVAQRSTHGQVLSQRIVQGAHRVAPGHGRVICLSASRSTFA
jgi:hypothetical protein